MVSAATMVGEGPRSKRGLILESASRNFAQTGYEATKWSTVADEVGIGQTALYHYFESKAHCLLAIMRLQLEQTSASFNEVTASESDPFRAIQQNLLCVYDVSDSDIRQLRVLHGNLAMLSTPRAAVREEADRRASRILVRDYELAWTELFGEAMATGQIPSRDPRLLARAVLGLAVSVWSWFSPDGELSIETVGQHTVDCCLRVITD